MRKHLLAIFALAPLLAFSQSGIDLPKSHEGETYQFLPFKAWVNDSSTTNKAIKGKTVFVNFWFENCAPCKAEFEGLNELYEKMKDSSNFAFVSFTFESQSVIKDVRDKYKLSFPIASMSKQDCSYMNFGSGYPTNIIVGKDKKVKYFHTGGAINKDRARDDIMKKVYPEILKAL